MGVKPFFGLQGNALLRAAVILVVCPTFTCYGYNMSVAGGLLTLSAFNKQFPRMDTINTTGAQQEENSQIQGESMRTIPEIWESKTPSIIIFELIFLIHALLQQALSLHYIRSAVFSALFPASTLVISLADARSSSLPTLFQSLVPFLWLHPSSSLNSSLPV